MGYVVEQDRGPNIFPAFSLHPPHGFQLPHALQIYCPAPALPVFCIRHGKMLY